jgi:multiple sugar transport system permease protein
MGTMMVPAFMNMIPMFMVMDTLGWIDTHRASTCPVRPAPSASS